jgi:AbrB family looped-hinge helix DNA binding protein
MFKDNLTALRKENNLSQEALADRLGISRQTLSKYETGESLPDIEKCRKIAEVFEVSLDDLVNYEKEAGGLGVPPKGKHIFGVVRVGDKGQIVIPSKARKIFHIQTGDRLIVLGDENQGLALLNEKDFMQMVTQIHDYDKDATDGAVCH